MTDYGHDLLFGSFITPVAEQPDLVVELAQLSEQAALDVVTVQDHPYLAHFLDAWTLLAYLAAATTRIRLAPNVINLPLRQPAVLARSAASLDLLSGGRVELGLGAGAFWEAIEANGGRQAGARRSRRRARRGDRHHPPGMGHRPARRRPRERRPFTVSRAPSAARLPRTISASGLAATSRACLISLAAGPTAGCRACPTCRAASRSCPTSMRGSTRQPPRPGVIHDRCDAC